MCLNLGFATIDNMKLEYISQTKLQKLIKEVFEKYLPNENYRLFFFGSRVSGVNSPRSDIDLGIESSHSLSSKTKIEIEEECKSYDTFWT